MTDAHKNFATSLVATAPSPATSGTSLVVTSGEGALFPAVPFNVVICPAATAATSTNAEIARVTARSTDTLTLTRAQEGSSARTVVVGDQIYAAPTLKWWTDIEPGGVGGLPVIVRRTADSATRASTTTFADDDTLLFAAAANDIWLVKVVLLIKAANGTMDFKAAWTVPSGATMLHGALGNPSSQLASWGDAVTGGTPLSLNAAGTGVQIGTLNSATTPMGAEFQGMYVGGANAGNVAFRWAQVTSDAGDLILAANSLLIAQRVA